MKTLKNLAFAAVASLTMTACSTMQSPVTISTTSSTPTKITKDTVKTPDLNIGEKARIENLGYQKKQYEKLLPSTEYDKYELVYEGGQAIIKKVKDFDLVKTNYAFTQNPEGIRYAMLALVDPRSKDVAHASIRIVSSTGTDFLAVDGTISEKQRKEAPTRDFKVVLDADGRVFELNDAPEGAKDFCNEHGCRYERAYDMKVSPEFLFYYANGGAFSLVSDKRPVAIYVPPQMVRDFYNGLKQASK